MNVIEVREPQYNTIQKLKKWWYGYSYKFEKWQNSLPKEGDKIKYIWLPNPINNPFEKSIWIGTSGVVFDIDRTNGSFCLKLKSGATLIHTGGNFDYIKITQ